VRYRDTVDHARQDGLLDRRQFLVSASLAAGGFALGIVSTKSQAASVPWSSGAREGNELGAWVEISDDDTVTMRLPTPEIGNGAMTQMAMNITEELGCDWSRVKVQFCSIQRDYLEKGVYNSGFLPFFGGHGTDPVRMAHALQLGASARERLKAAAASRWRVPVAEITAQNSVLTHVPTGRNLSYGEVASAAVAVKLPAEPALKPQNEWTFLAKKSPGKLHAPAVASGSAVFGLDVVLPGMVHAALLQSPVHGGKLKSYESETVMSMPGVRAVVVIDAANTKGTPVPDKSTWGFGDNQVQSGIAVIADQYWQAKRALDALPVEWDPGEGMQWKSEQQIYAAARALLDESGGTVLRHAGDPATVKGDKIIEAEYSTPYCENAMMEPLNGTAMVTADKAEVWCPTQDMLMAYWVTIDETGQRPEKVKINPTLVGGGFGRRTMADDVRMVVAVASKYPGVPVKTIWSREQCFQQGRFRTPIISRFRAALGKDGYPLAVTSRASFVGTRPAFRINMGYEDMPYFTSGIIPNVHFSAVNLPMNILNGAYRGPCFNSHAFFTETFIDECAVAAGIDPLAYRLKLVSQWDKPWTDCLRVAAEKAGWGQPLPRGEGRGIAITSWPAAAHHDMGTIMCTAARVKVSRNGELEVRQVDVAFECGRVANPGAVRSQIEGGTIFGMNMTLNERLSVKDGAIVERNFNQYRMLRIDDHLPIINVHFDALSGHNRFDIIGEAPVAPIGPAIGNAIYQATGKRLRTTPFRDHDLSWS
jgi:isoquinoline 1-oxidoreductase beta subunit